MQQKNVPKVSGACKLVISDVYKSVCSGNTVREAIADLSLEESESDIQQALFDEYGKDQMLSIFNKEVFPGLLQQGKHLTREMLRVLAMGVKHADEPLRKKRRTICHACPSLLVGRCKHCKCPIENTIRYTDTSCEEGKW